MRIVTLRIKTLQHVPTLLPNITQIGGVSNPTVIPFMGRNLVASGSFGRGILFAWLDKEEFNIIQENILGIGPGLAQIEGNKTHLSEGDARVIVLNETSFMLVCNGFYSPRRPRYVVIGLNKTSSMLMIERE